MPKSIGLGIGIDVTIYIVVVVFTLNRMSFAKCQNLKSSNKLSARGHESARAIRRSKEHTQTYIARKKKGETSPKRST